MAKNLTLAPNKSITWVTIFAWGFLIIFAGKFVLNDALPYFGLNEEVFGE